MLNWNQEYCNTFLRNTPYKIEQNTQRNILKNNARKLLEPTSYSSKWDQVRPVQFNLQYVHKPQQSEQLQFPSNSIFTTIKQLPPPRIRYRDDFERILPVDILD